MPPELEGVVAGSQDTMGKLHNFPFGRGTPSIFLVDNLIAKEFLFKSSEALARLLGFVTVLLANYPTRQGRTVYVPARGGDGFSTAILDVPGGLGQ